MRHIFNILFTSVVMVLGIAEMSATPINATTTDLPPLAMARPESSPSRQLDDLIIVTEKSLADQKQLKRQVTDYLKVKARYLKDQQNKDNIVQLVKAAHQVQQSIETQRLSYVFDSELLEELKFFSQIASKKGLPPPQ